MDELPKSSIKDSKPQENGRAPLETFLGAEKVRELITSSVTRGNVFSDYGLSATIYECPEDLSEEQVAELSLLKGRPASRKLLVKKAKPLHAESPETQVEDTNENIKNDARLARAKGIAPFAVAVSLPIRLTDGQWAFLMEFAGGINANSLEILDVINPKEMLRIAYQFAMVKEAAHYHGICAGEIKMWHYENNAQPPRLVLFDFEEFSLPAEGIDRARVINQDLQEYSTWLFKNTKLMDHKDAVNFLDGLDRLIQKGEFKSFRELADFLNRLSPGLAQEYKEITGHEPLKAIHPVTDADWEAVREEVRLAKLESERSGKEHDKFRALFSGLPEELSPSIINVRVYLRNLVSIVGRDRDEILRRMLKICQKNSELSAQVNLPTAGGKSLLEAMLDILEANGYIK